MKNFSQICRLDLICKYPLLMYKINTQSISGTGR